MRLDGLDQVRRPAIMKEEKALPQSPEYLNL